LQAHPAPLVHVSLLAIQVSPHALPSEQTLQQALPLPPPQPCNAGAVADASNGNDRKVNKRSVRRMSLIVRPYPIYGINALPGWQFVVSQLQYFDFARKRTKKTLQLSRFHIYNICSPESHTSYLSTK
jgi:hypothetical protein